MAVLPILNCDNCGACCMTMGHPPFFWAGGQVTVDEYWIRMPEPLRAQLDSYLESLDEPDSDVGRPCVWLDLESGHCRNYEHRPQPCRDYERGCPACYSARATFEIR